MEEGICEKTNFKRRKHKHHAESGSVVDDIPPTGDLDRAVDPESDFELLQASPADASVGAPKESPKGSKPPRNVYAVSLRKPPFALNRRENILEVARDMFARQKWSTLKELTSIFLRDLRMPGFLLMKNFFILLYSTEAQHIDRRELHKFATSFILLLDNQKYEFLLELAMYILNNEKTMLSEKPFLVDLRTQMEKRSRRANWTKTLTMLRQTYQLYEEYLEFIEWKTVQSDQRNFAPSAVHSNYPTSSYMATVLENLSSKIKANLSRVIAENEHPEMSLDIGVLMLLQLYDHDNELTQALELLRQYALKNVDHMHAHIYLYEFLVKFPDIPNVDDSVRIDALRNIVRLCPDSRYTLRLVNEPPAQSGLATTERLQMLADFVDYLHNRRSKKAWQLMYRTLAKFNSEDAANFEAQTRLQQFFSTRLPYWERIHFALLELDRILPQLRQFYRARSHSDSDYSSDISTGSETLYTGRGGRRKAAAGDSPIASHLPAVSGKEYSLYLFKGRVLANLSQLQVPLSANLERYREAIAAL